MKSVRNWSIALLMMALLAGAVKEANAQVVYYRSRPFVVGVGYPYYYPTYEYYGGWYPGSYQNIYGNFPGMSYHVMQPIWTGGYRYRYW